MTTTCPACHKTVDPLRSRFVGVQGDKVVAYCSADCAGRTQATQATKSATQAPTGVVTPPAGAVASSPSPPRVAAVAATGVPERIATPPVGVPARVQTPATGVPLGPPRPITPAPGVPVDPSRASDVVDSGPVIEIVHEPASGVVTSARDERTELRAKHPDEIAITEFWSADREKSGAVRAVADPGSGPVAAPVDGDDAASPAGAPGRAPGGVIGSADVARHRAVRPPSDQGADTDIDAEPARKSRLPVLVLLVLLIAAGGYLAYQYFLRGNLAAATKVTPSPAARASPWEGPGGSREAVAPRAVAGTTQAALEAHAPAHRVGAATPAIDVDAALEQARATLHGDLSATSPRVRRIAAEALARTEDPAARDVLAAQLSLPVADDARPRDRSAAAPPVQERETSDIARLDLAYALARGGDPRGAQALASALGSVRGEVRDEGARLLALLGDPRAVPHLTDLLAVSQRRLGAAEHLAHLAEPHAIKVLEQIRGDAKTSADDRARATIALGIARHADVAPALRGMLGDPHFNAFVAAALAELKDGAARPVLEQQLESPALRVRAARALRRLDPALDPKPILARLIEVLKTGRDIDQVQAAEAILLLAGSATWSAYD